MGGRVGLTLRGWAVGALGVDFFLNAAHAAHEKAHAAEGVGLGCGRGFFDL